MTLQLQVLSNQDILAKAPSVGALEPWEGVSDKYQFIPTLTILDFLRDAGWNPVSAQESRVRISAKKGFQKHLIKLEHSDFSTPPALGEDRFQILLTVHARSSSRSAFGVWYASTGWW